MTVFLGSEALVAAVVMKLQAEMPTRVEAINLEKNDDVTIAAPDSNSYFVAAQRLIGAGSAVLVMNGPMRVVPRGEGVHSLNTQTQIAVWVKDEDANEQRLGLKLQRLGRAVIESLWDGEPKEQLANPDGSQLAWRLVPDQTVPGPAFQPEGGGPNLREFFLVTFLVSRFEGD